MRCTFSPGKRPFRQRPRTGMPRIHAELADDYGIGRGRKRVDRDRAI